MSRLQPNQPNPMAGRPYTPNVVKVGKKAEKTVVAASWQACDKCGYSQIDNQPIARALVEIEVGESSISLCDHCFNEHTPYVLERNYEFRRLV